MQRIDGTVKLPGSKSLSNRILLLAALADGTTEIENLLVRTQLKSRPNMCSTHNMARGMPIVPVYALGSYRDGWPAEPKSCSCICCQLACKDGLK